MKIEKEDHIIEKAKEVLNNNHQPGGFTLPCQGLYPFQWNWDSGFIAIGYAHYDMVRAMKELHTLLDAQWENGFIPHIVFHNESDTYFPGPDYHEAGLHPQSSERYRSSGMTQPPVLGFVLKRIYEIADNKPTVLSQIKKLIDKVFKNHEYFYTHRDPNQEGLVYIYHNWESGTDNSPIWDGVFEHMDPPEYEFERRDTTHVDASQRPSKREYDHYLHIIEIAKQNRYDDTKIAELSPFLVQDPLLNAMLISSNEALIYLYELLGDTTGKIVQLKAWQDKAKRQFNQKLFDEELGAYVHYDLRNDTPIRKLCSSSFAPLFANIPDGEKASKMVDSLMERFGSPDQYLCASFDPTSEDYNPKKYWRGPVWINVNWLLHHGVKYYGYDELADRIKEDTLTLIEKYGFYEYFDARKGASDTGYGGNNFSWSAALTIDLLKQNTN